MEVTQNINEKLKIDSVDDGYPIVNGMNTLERMLKSVFDFSFSGVLMLVFSPMFLACYLAVRLEDGGKAIYKQKRVGKGGKSFDIYKFRSMKVDAEKDGPQLFNATGDDPRLTKVGRFLREHHLDELPQLWNVLKGDMSFVGPRPEREYYIDKIMETDPRYTYLYQIRPGVTSYATLYNGYTDTLDKMIARLHYDLFYLKNGSLKQDMKILWFTFAKIVGGKKF